MVIDDAAANDRPVIALRAKITVTDDGQSGAPTRIELDTTNGRSLSTACDVNTPPDDLIEQRRHVLDNFRN
jgi:hypothetical protein